MCEEAERKLAPTPSWASTWTTRALGADNGMLMVTAAGTAVKLR